jgi:hypothetical protein
VTREAVLSPVEDRLYIISSVYEESGWSIPAGMQILNPATGQILTDYETEATDLVLDQGRLYLYRQTEAGYWTEILDADNLEAIMSRRDQLIRPARLLNSDPTLLSDTYNAGTTSLTTFDPTSLAAWHSWEIDGYNRWLISR